MKIEYMREFLHAATVSNFTLAASDLYLTQPTLTRHISSIEESLGVQCFFRMENHMRLTDAGQKVYEAFEEIVRKYDALETWLSAKSSGMSGSLSLGLLYYGTDKIVSPILSSFQSAYPGIQLRFTFQAHHVERDLLDGKIDIGEVIASPSNSFKQLRLVSFYQTGYLAMTLRSHPLAQKKQCKLEDLSQEKIILLRNDELYNNNTKSLFEKHGFSPEYVFSDEMNSVIYTLRECGGIFLTSADLDNFTYSDVAFIPVSGKDLFCDYAFAYKTSNCNSVIPLFIQHIAKFKEERH